MFAFSWVPKVNTDKPLLGLRSAEFVEAYAQKYYFNPPCKPPQVHAAGAWASCTRGGVSISGRMHKLELVFIDDISDRSRAAANA